jgi:hypothetical protein
MRLVPTLALLATCASANPKVTVLTFGNLGESGFDVQPCYAYLSLKLAVQDAANATEALKDFTFEARVLETAAEFVGEVGRPRDFSSRYALNLDSHGGAAVIVVPIANRGRRLGKPLSDREESVMQWQVWASYRGGPYYRVPNQPLMLSTVLPCTYAISESEDPAELAVSPAYSVAYGAGLVRVFGDSVATFHVQLNDRLGNAANMSAHGSIVAKLNVSIRMATNTVVRERALLSRWGWLHTPACTEFVSPEQPPNRAVSSRSLRCGPEPCALCVQDSLCGAALDYSHEIEREHFELACSSDAVGLRCV